MISPSSTPWIADHIVVQTSSRICSITNCNNCVIKRSPTSSTRDNTSCILVEYSFRCINCNRSRTQSDCSHKLGLWITLYMVDFFHLDRSIIIGITIVIYSLVRIIRFKTDASVILDIVHAVVLPTTAATKGVPIAIHTLLLRKFQKSIALNKMLSFHLSDSWESPAWSTLSLILNRINCSFWNPVNWYRKIITLKQTNVWSRWTWYVISNFLPFFSCPIRELIESYSWSLSRCLIKNIDFNPILSKLFASELIILNWLIVLLEFCNIICK